MPSGDKMTSVSAWRSETESLTIVTDGTELPGLVAEAAAWAERITLCVSAPQSERGTLAWWRELFARSSKCSGVFVRQAQRGEGWLLHRLHAIGALRLVEAGGKQVAGNLWMFARGEELRVVLTHIPLERAVAGAAFGALLAFRGRSTAELGRACEAQLESWADLARIPTGNEIDALTLDARRRGPLPVLQLPRSPRVVVEPVALSDGLERLADATGSTATTSPAAPFSAHAPDAGLSVRAFAGGYRVALGTGGESRFALTLYTGAAWGAGNALLLDDASGGVTLVWRGGLLGPSRSRADLFWSEARLGTVQVEDAALGIHQRVAIVARSGAPIEPQVAAFTRELGRLIDVFGVEPPPALGHVLADFSMLSPRQQTLLIGRTLIGTGPLGVAGAASAAAEALRDQGYLRGQDIAPGGAVHGSIVELLAAAADDGAGFDRPTPDTIRAVQSDASAFVLDDWLECLVRALPENTVIDQRLALRLAFERARELWGLAGESVAQHGVERALEAAISTALWRGLLVRVGAGGLKRLGRESAYPELPPAVVNACPRGFVRGFAQLLERLEPVQRFLLTRRAGWYGRRESIESVAHRLGLTPERGRQLESDAWQMIASSSGWARELRARLERAFAGESSIRARDLELDDAWWQGTAEHLELADAVFEGLLGGQLHRVELGTLGEVFFTHFTPAQVGRAKLQLFAQAAHVPAPASFDAYQRCAEVASEPLDAVLGEGLHAALAARLELDREDATRGFSFNPEARAELEAFPTSPKGVDSEALLRLEDVVRSLFRAAGTPLSLAAVLERLQKRLDVDDALLAQRLAIPPFVRRNLDQYGLIARDVPGGHEAIASVLNDIAKALYDGQRALGPDPVWAIVQAHVQQAWSPELVRSLIGADPVLSLSPSNDTGLRRWEHARLLPHGPVICPGVPPAARPRFDKLAEQAPRPRAAIAERLSAELSRLERAGDADDLYSLPLARQLGDVCERLLEHAAEPASLAQAAVEFFLEAVAPDEDDLDAALIDRERLLEARAVIAAVLRWLGLSWLETDRSPPR